MDAAWPLLTARHPDARITIVGSNPPERLRELAAADPRIEVTGFVDDVRPYFARATAAICPIRDGGGTRIKVLDALAQGKPLIATSIGCEGLEVVPDRDVLIGDTPEAFAAQVGRVFDDAALRASLARQGRAARGTRLRVGDPRRQAGGAVPRTSRGPAASSPQPAEAAS